MLRADDTPASVGEVGLYVRGDASARAYRELALSTGRGFDSGLLGGEFVMLVSGDDGLVWHSPR